MQTISNIRPLNELAATVGMPKNFELTEKIRSLASKLVSTINQETKLSQNRVKVTASPKYIPLIYKMLEMAYMDFDARKIDVNIKDPELERLKQYQTKDLSFKARTQKEFDLDEMNAYEISFDAGNTKQKITAPEVQKLEKSVVPEISDEAHECLKVDPDMILGTCLNMKAGQPVLIKGYREHMPNIRRLTETAFEKGASSVDYEITEHRNYDFHIPLIKYGTQSALNDDIADKKAIAENRLNNRFISIRLDGEDPDQKKNLNAEGAEKDRIHQAAVNKAKKKAWIESTNIPWIRYYLPTVELARKAQPPYNTFLEAAQDAQKICSNIKEHLDKQTQITKKLNKLLEDGYRKIRFKSSDPSKPTDLSIEIPKGSPFLSGYIEDDTGTQPFLPNVPTRESFVAPNWRTAHGTMYTTKPVEINGQVVPEGAMFEFTNGKLTNYDDGGRNILRDWILNNENADKLGEIALVAESELSKMRDLFYSIVCDENATCHAAGGTALASLIPGFSRMPPQDKKELEKVLNIDSSTHKDFMIGGPKVKVTIEDPSGSSKTLIENDRYNRKVFDFLKN